MSRLDRRLGRLVVHSGPRGSPDGGLDWLLGCRGRRLWRQVDGRSRTGGRMLRGILRGVLPAQARTNGWSGPP